MNVVTPEIKVDCRKMSKLTRNLLGSSVYADLIAHFNDPENQRRFEEWKKERRAKLNGEGAAVT